MENRRVLFKTLLAAGLTAATPSPSRADVIHKQPLSGKFDGLEATFVEVIFEPGQASKPHRHPGFVLGYVLEGRFRFGVKGGPEQVFEPGDVFYEPPGAVHMISGNAGDTTTRVLAIVVAEIGVELSTPA